VHDVEEERWTDAELSELYRRYGFLILRRCRTLLNDEAAAEDALQDAFMKFMHHKEAWRAAANPIAWMYRVVDRCCFDQLRRRKHRRADSIDDHENEPNPCPGVDVEARNIVIRILHALSEPEYEIAVMAYVDGMNQTEIAEALGLSRPTIWKRLTIIRKRAMLFAGDFP
jgi:RNA polymerase sigma-70 factor (ECF subfamily)